MDEPTIVLRDGNVLAPGEWIRGGRLLDPEPPEPALARPRPSAFGYSGMFLASVVVAVGVMIGAGAFAWLNNDRAALAPKPAAQVVTRAPAAKPSVAAPLAVPPADPSADILAWCTATHNAEPWCHAPEVNSVVPPVHRIHLSSAKPGRRTGRGLAEGGGSPVRFGEPLPADYCPTCCPPSICMPRVR